MDGIDLRKEFKGLMDNYSSYALLVRVDAFSECSCVNSLSRAPLDDCKRCLGTGKVHTAEKIRIRSKMTTSSETLPKNISNKAFGAVSVGVREFYINHLIRAKKNDLLLFCEWNGEMPLLNQYSSLYRILNADNLQADGGRMEYIKVTSEDNPVNFRIKFNGMVSNINTSEYYLTIREE